MSFPRRVYYQFAQFKSTQIGKVESVCVIGTGGGLVGYNAYLGNKLEQSSFWALREFINCLVCPLNSRRFSKAVF